MELNKSRVLYFLCEQKAVVQERYALKILGTFEVTLTGAGCVAPGLRLERGAVYPGRHSEGVGGGLALRARLQPPRQHSAQFESRP